MAGRFQGKLPSSLSDEELRLFMRVDARRQTTPAFQPLEWPNPLNTPRPQAPHYSPDLSQYWFAKYELERRMPEQKRPFSLELSASDSDETIALKLLRRTFVLADFMECGDVRVFQRRHRPRLAFPMAAELGLDEFEGDAAAQACVLGFVDHAHAAFA